ncbi:MAG: ABC transporter ATP-binding protein [Gemmatimonadota bacterium]
MLATGHDLSYRYRDGTWALRGVDVSVRRGEVVALVGPNGSGKTTLLRMLATATVPAYGTLRLLAESGSLPLRELRRRLAVVFDYLPIHPDLTGGENLAHLTRLRGVTRDARAISRWLTRFGLADRAGRRASTYSLGQRRRLALAEAFASGAELLLLDEPLIGLDVEARAVLAHALEEHSARGGGAVVALHDASFAAGCDRVILLYGGRVVAEGAPAQLVGGLERQTVFEVEWEGIRLPGGPPEGVVALGSDDGIARFASAGGSGQLPEFCGWLVRGGVELNSVRIREPDLDDVFLSMTGASLGVQDSP